MASPNSYRDQYWSDLAGKEEQKRGLPDGLLVGIVTRGERSNADQISEAGARTPFQIIDATRKAAIAKWGVDPYLSDENAAEVAGRLLKDSMDRNKGDVATAVAEYHGGTNREAWGPRTRAYVNRVMTGLQAAPANGETQSAPKQAQEAPKSLLENDFAKWMAANPAVPSKPQTPQATPSPTQDKLSADFGQWFSQEGPKAGLPAEPPPEQMGLLAKAKEYVTGEQRATEATRTLPDWATMPELNSLSSSSFKTGLGTLLTNPAETVQVIQSNYPNVQVRQDEKGNYLLKSGIDGQEYAIKPGFAVSDIPRLLGGVAAFSPAAKATTIGGSALAAGATQAAIEGTQAATGGKFDSGDVLLSAAGGAAAPVVARGIKAVAQPVVERLKGALGFGTEAAPAAVDAGAAKATTSQAPMDAMKPAATAEAAGAAPLSSEELAQTAKTAAGGGFGSEKATKILAEQAAPNPKTVQAAERLGISDYLQPDHLTTNQAYRELAQAVKSVPGSATRASEISGLESVAKRADDLISEIGGTSDMSMLDASIRGRLQQTHAKLSGQAEDLYAQVNAKIPRSMKVEAPTTLDFLKSEAANMGGAERMAPVERRLMNSLSAVNGESPVTYAFLDKTRKEIGQAMSKASGPFKDSESGLLKKLYATLSEDQNRIASAQGVGHTYEAAKYATRLTKGIEDDMTSLFGKQLDRSLVGDLSSSVASLPKGDVSKMTNLLRAIPPEMRQNVVASGLNTAFGKTARNGSLNAGSYAAWYEGLLRNRQAYAAVMSNLPPQARKQLSDLYRVSKGISLATRERITTGRIQAVQQEIQGADSLMANIFHLAKKSAVGMAAEAVTTPLGAPGAGLSAGIASALTKGKPNAMKAADALISSPEFLQAAKQAGKPGQAEAVKKLAASAKFKAFVKEVGAPSELSDGEKWILSAMQSGRNMGGDANPRHNK